MPTTGIDRTDHGAAIATIIAQEALGALSRYSTMAEYVSRDYDEQIAAHGEAVKIFKRGSLTAQNKAIGADVTFGDPSGAGSVTVTLDKHKVVAFAIEDIGRLLSRPDLLMGYAEDSAVALGEAVDDDLLALATDGAVTTQKGAAGAAITRDVMIDTKEVLDTAKAPRAGRHLMIAPSANSGFLKQADVKSADSFGQATTSGDLPSGLYGFEPHVSQGVTVTAGSPNRTNNLAFQRNAIVLATRPLALPANTQGVNIQFVNVGGVGIRVLTQYDIRAMATLVTLDLLYGVKIVRPEHVVRVAS